MSALKKFTPRLLLIVCLLVTLSSQSNGGTKRSKNRPERAPNRAETREAESRLADMGYWTGPVDGVIDRTTRTALIAFQKMEGRKITGRLRRADRRNPQRGFTTGERLKL